RVLVAIVVARRRIVSRPAPADVSDLWPVAWRTDASGDEHDLARSGWQGTRAFHAALAAICRLSGIAGRRGPVVCADVSGSGSDGRGFRGDLRPCRCPVRAGDQVAPWTWHVYVADMAG